MNPAAALAPEAAVAHGAARRAATSGAVLLVENMVRMMLTAAMSFWVARSLGPAEFGLLNFASALTAILYALATLGLEVPSVLRLARGEDPSRLLGTVLRLRLLAALAGVGLAGLAGTLLRAGEPHAQAVTLIVAMSVVGYVPTVLDYAFKAAVDAGPPAAARVATTLLSSAAKAAVLLGGGSLTALAWTVVLESLLLSALLFGAWRRQAGAGGPPPFGAYDATLARSLLPQGLPLLGAAVATAVHLKADVVLLGTWAGDLQAGQYALAQKLSEVMYVVPLVAIDSIYPLLARRADQGPPEAREQTMFDLAAALAMIAAALAVLLAPWLIGWTFGPRYADTADLWRWHVLTCVAVALDVARQRWLVAQGLQRHALGLSLMGAAISVGLNAWLLPRHGAPGAAVAACVSWFAMALAGTWLSPRLRPVARMQWRALFPWPRMWRLLRDASGPAAAHAAGAAPTITRVLFVHQSSDLYGSDRMLLASVQAVRGAGAEVIVMLPGDGPLVPALRAAGAEVHAVAERDVMKLRRASLAPRGLTTLLRAPRTSRRAIDGLLAGRRVDRVVSSTLAVLGGALWARARGVPHTWHVHEIIERPHAAARLLPRLVDRWSDRVVCNSAATRDWLLVHRPGLAPRLRVVHNGVDDLGARVAARAPCAGTRLTVGLVGRVNAWKGHEVLLAACEALHVRGRDDIELVFVGDAPPGQPEHMQRLAARIAASPLAARVRVTGFQADVAPALAGMDIVCVPSVLPEPFGLVAIEAMSAGRPVVASRIGGLPEIVRDGVDGLLVPPGEPTALAEALVALADDPLRRAGMGRAARLRYEQAFTIEAMRRHIVEALLGARAGSTP